jgi:hypothetical protein
MFFFHVLVPKTILMLHIFMCLLNENILNILWEHVKQWIMNMECLKFFLKHYN